MNSGYYIIIPEVTVQEVGGAVALTGLSGHSENTTIIIKSHMIVM